MAVRTSLDPVLGSSVEPEIRRSVCCGCPRRSGRCCTTSCLQMGGSRMLGGEKSQNGALMRQDCFKKPGCGLLGSVNLIDERAGQVGISSLGKHYCYSRKEAQIWGGRIPGADPLILTGCGGRLPTSAWSGECLGPRFHPDFPAKAEQPEVQMTSSRHLSLLAVASAHRRQENSFN